MVEGAWGGWLGLFQVDEALADFSAANDFVFDVGAVTPADRAGHGLSVFGETGEHFEDRVLIGLENVAPHFGVGGGDAGEVAEAGGGELQDLLAGFVGQVIGGAANGEGDEMGEMGDDGEDAVVVRGVHPGGLGAGLLPELFDFLDGLFVGAGGWGEEGPAALEERGEA